jgi:hypothetical protein
MPMIYTDEQLINRVETKAAGFAGWKVGVYLVAVRSSDDIPDAFDDKAYVYECKKDGVRPTFFMVASCTTHPGVDVLKNFAWKKGYNKAGAPLLKSDTIVYESHTHGKHKGTYYAYRQSKAFPYTRDTDKDVKAEEQGPVAVGNISAHVHRASEFKVSPKNINWSAGCIVMNDPNKFNAFMAFMAKRPLSLCILQQF